MPTKVDVINEALVALGQPPVAGPSDTSTWVMRLTNRYPAVTRKLLEQHNWDFAKIKEELARLPTATGGREFSYNKPAKCLNIIFINNTGEDSDNEFHDYDHADGKIHSDYDAMFMWFISSDYLAKEGSWPQVFASAVAAELAATCAPISTKDNRLREGLVVAARTALKKAKSFDAMQKPFRKHPKGDWSRSRRAGSRYNTEGH